MVFWRDGRDEGAMRRLLGLGIATALAVASGAAWAQDLTAGKSPSQLFSSDCSACHRSPGGLAKGRDTRSLAGFLKEHYTTKPEYASALAGYVAGFTGAAPPPEPKRGRRDADVNVTGDEIRPRADELPQRRRRTVNLSGDGEKPRARDGGEGSRPPGLVPGLPAEASREGTRPNRAAGPPAVTRRGEPADPLEQIRAFLGSGLSVESAAEAAAKVRTAKPRLPRQNVAQPQAEQAPLNTAAAPPAAAQPAVPAAVSPTAPANAPPAAPAVAPPAPANPAAANPFAELLSGPPATAGGTPAEPAPGR